MSLEGKKYNSLTIIKELDKKGSLRIVLCKCDCGNDKIGYYSNVAGGKTSHCGCLAKKKKYTTNDLIGKKFGRLYVSGYEIINNRIYCECSCDCGNKKDKLYLGQLVSGAVKSCGCLQTERNRQKKHQMTKTPFYSIWSSMKGRCNNPTDVNYQYYGSKGIRVSEARNSFGYFYNDMFEAYQEHVKQHGRKNTTLDRINVTGPYSCENCRWATMAEQNNNKSNSLSAEEKEDYHKKYNRKRYLKNRRLKKHKGESPLFTLS